MTIPRSRLVCNHVEGTYHCISRCVRRAFLCGYDAFQNRNFEHRRSWLRSRLKELSTIFYVDVCGYSIMENHLHTILRNRPSLANQATSDDIAERWWRLFPKRRNSQNQPEEPTEAELDLILAGPEREEELRNRLSSISWFMRCLKENIARRANAEDKCTGCFWEGRFKSIALLDKAAILTCSTYVDLNPVRAEIAETPETSDYTSAQDRIIARQAKKEHAIRHSKPDKISLTELKERMTRDNWLAPLENDGHRRGYLHIPLDKYLALLDWTGRQIKEGKNGHIPGHLVPILERLEVEEKEWLSSCQHFGSLFYRAAGKARSMKDAAIQAGQKWLQGLSAGRVAFTRS